MGDDEHRQYRPYRPGRGYQFGKLIAKGAMMTGYGVILGFASVITSQAILVQTSAQTRELLAQRKQAEEELLKTVRETIREFAKIKGEEKPVPKLLQELYEKDPRFVRYLEDYIEALNEQKKKQEKPEESVSPRGAKIVSVPGVPKQAPQVMPELVEEN